MALDLSQVQQRLDQVITNADSFIRNWTDFLAAPAGTINMQYYDKNGNLQTVSFSNKNKLVQDFIANANSVMEKTVYVDQVNGNDGNDGSSSNPFKTLQRAVNSVPFSGVVNIILANDYTLGSNEVVGIAYKTVSLNLNGKTLSTSYQVSSSASSYSQKGSIRINNGMLQLTVGNGKIVIPPNDIGKPLDRQYFGLINVNQYSIGNIIIYIGSSAGGNWCEINDGALISCSEWSDSRSIINVLLYPHYNRTLQLYGNYTTFIDAKGSLLNLFAIITNNGDNGYIKRDSNTITVKDAVAGIIKDSNGIPRNVVSNIIF